MVYLSIPCRNFDTYGSNNMTFPNWIRSRKINVLCRRRPNSCDGSATFAGLQGVVTQAGRGFRQDQMSTLSDLDLSQEPFDGREPFDVRRGAPDDPTVERKTEGKYLCMNGLKVNAQAQISPTFDSIILDGVVFVSASADQLNIEAPATFRLTTM